MRARSRHLGSHTRLRSFRTDNRGHTRRRAILKGLVIGFVLTGAGALISWASIHRRGQAREPLAAFVIGPLVLSLFAKTGLATMKFRYGRRLHSAALTADAWNDAMEYHLVLVHVEPPPERS